MDSAIFDMREFGGAGSSPEPRFRRAGRSGWAMPGAARRSCRLRGGSGWRVLLAVAADAVGGGEHVEEVLVEAVDAGGEAAPAGQGERCRRWAGVVLVPGFLVVDLAVGCRVVGGDEHLPEVDGEVLGTVCLVAAGAQVLC